MSRAVFLLEDSLGQKHQYNANDELTCEEIIGNANAELGVKKLRGARIVRLVEMISPMRSDLSDEHRRKLSSAAKARWSKQGRARGACTKRK